MDILPERLLHVEIKLLVILLKFKGFLIQFKVIPFHFNTLDNDLISSHFEYRNSIQQYSDFKANPFKLYYLFRRTRKVMFKLFL
jgi:hypothetical protein